MVSLKCQQCGAALHWDGRSNIVRCSYCGAEYLMHPRDNFGASFNRYEGRGEIQGIPIMQGGDFAGMCPVESYVPREWRVQCRQAAAELYGDQASNPFVVQAEYYTPDGSAFAVFRTSNVYTDRKLSRFPLMNNVDVMGSFMRIGQPFTAEQYCDYIVQRDICPVKFKRLRVDQADNAELQRQKTIYNQYMGQGFSSMTSDWKRVLYAVLDQRRQNRVVAVETRVNDGYKGQPQMQGGLLGQFMGQMFASAQHFWETQYEILVAADPAQYNQVWAEVKKIDESFKTTQDFEQIRQTMMQMIQGLVSQTASAMSQQEMASWDRKSKIIQDTHNYTTNVMHDIQANTAATHARVANLRSESIRGVNTYYNANPGFGRPDVVEASVNWDHVYQSRINPDLFAASENYWLEPGVDFEELRRTNGNY